MGTIRRRLSGRCVFMYCRPLRSATPITSKPRPSTRIRPPRARSAAAEEIDRRLEAEDRHRAALLHIAGVEEAPPADRELPIVGVAVIGRRQVEAAHAISGLDEDALLGDVLGEDGLDEIGVLALGSRGVSPRDLHANALAVARKPGGGARRIHHHQAPSEAAELALHVLPEARAPGHQQDDGGGSPEDAQGGGDHAPGVIREDLDGLTQGLAKLHQVTRSAVEGSTRAAIRAGAIPATRPTAVNTAKVVSSTFAETRGAGNAGGSGA